MFIRHYYLNETCRLQYMYYVVDLLRMFAKAERNFTQKYDRSTSNQLTYLLSYSSANV